jgi:hypothetical protein
MDDKKTLIDPSTVFNNPQDVVERNDLSRDQKIEILRSWEYDIRELQVADEEGMPPSASQPVSLDAVAKALHLLGVDSDVERSAATKQRGN